MAVSTRLLATAAACSALLASGAHAASFQNATGLAAPTSIETFDGTPLAAGTAAGTLFSGVTFSNDLAITRIADGWGPNFSGQSLGNFAGDECPCASFSEIHFASAVRGAAFSMFMVPTTATFSAYLGNTLVETATHQTSFDGQYIGFTGITFDRVVFGAQAVHPERVIDNLQITSVPEPQSYAMLLAGLVGMGVVARRKVRRA